LHDEVWKEDVGRCRVFFCLRKKITEYSKTNKYLEDVENILFSVRLDTYKNGERRDTGRQIKQERFMQNEDPQQSVA
jgi:hypothetical protein